MGLFHHSTEELSQRLKESNDRLMKIGEAVMMAFSDQDIRAMCKRNPQRMKEINELIAKVVK